MSYLAFALKYRPKNFDEVVGQEHVVIALRNAILKDRVHHAYLFSGPRGVGKTSLARIFAKSINCFEGPTPKPCEKCTSCLEINQARALDVIEIDGASNRGIDEIRTLRENIKLSATYSRYKVYIVDEVHMLTQEAFNALLKTLEEPPAHVKFVFATTHPHKVLPTILSRCQKFQFNLIPLEKIVDKLKTIIKAEKIKVDPDLLYTIARAAGGSIRDAESLLDQLVPVILEKGSIEDVFSFLGVIEETSLNELIKLLVDRDLPASIEFIDKITKSGKDLGVFLNAFIEHLRNLLLAKVSPHTFNNLGDISPQGKDFINSLTEKITVSQILTLLDGLIAAKDMSQRLVSVRIPLELALIKVLHTKDAEPAVPVKKDTPVKPSVDKPSPSKTKPKEDEFDFELDLEDFDNEDSNKENERGKEQNILSKEETPDDLVSDDALLPALRVKWKEIIKHLQKTRAALASHFSFAKPFSSEGNVVTIAFSPKDSFHKEMVESIKNSKLIASVISNFISKDVGVKFIIDDSVSGSQIPLKGDSVTPAKDEEVKSASVEDDSFLTDLLDTFDARFQSEDE